MDHLSTLPTEVLVIICDHLHNIEDFVNASSSCKVIRTAFADIKPNALLRLAAASSRVFFRPDPYFLIMATVRGVGQWGLRSAENTEILGAALRRGVYGLYNLCLEKGGLTMNEIRRLHLARFSLINPIADMIDRMAGRQWYATPNFWNGGVSEAYTIDCEPMRTLFQYVIYGELFGSTMQAFLQPLLQSPQYDLNIRLDYLRYCVPDWNSQEGRDPANDPPEGGPYSQPVQDGDGVALWYVVKCGRWNRPWAAVRQEIGPDFEAEWQQTLWENAVQCYGLEGLEMLRPGGVEKWRDRLDDVRKRIEQLDGVRAVRQVSQGNIVSYPYPCLTAEIVVCIRSFWGLE